MSSEMKKMLRDPFWDLKNTSTILEDMDWEFPELGNMVTRALRTVSEIVPSDATSSNRRYYYGYQVTVGPDGKPRDIRVARSLGLGLDEKAIEAVRQWKFEPAMKDGKPVAVAINVEVDFRLY